MRTITADERNLILDVTGEGLITLPAAALEKDVLVTEVLQRLVDIEVEGINLIFCGGTCLSKAYGLIGRMSEDIDFKVVVPTELSRSQRSKLLSHFKKHLIAVFAAEGFVVPEDEVIARDENSYIALNIRYESRFGVAASLRSEIKLELSARPLLLPVQMLPVRSIVEFLVAPETEGFRINCLGVPESVGEKVLSFLRRTSEVLFSQVSREYDDRLIRHLYDVAVINRRLPDLISSLACDVFEKMVEADAERFSRQFPEFRLNPVAEMRRSLEYLETDERLAAEYDRFVTDLVYGDQLAFEDARVEFIEFSRRLLS